MIIMTENDFAALPQYTVVETDDYVMVKTGENDWMPVGIETFWASNKQMGEEKIGGKFLFANPRVVACPLSMWYH